MENTSLPITPENQKLRQYLVSLLNSGELSATSFGNSPTAGPLDLILVFSRIRKPAEASGAAPVVYVHPGRHAPYSVDAIEGAIHEATGRRVRESPVTGQPGDEPCLVGKSAPIVELRSYLQK